MSLFDASELRLVQLRTNTSAANALYLDCGYPGCPRGKIWTLIGTALQPSVAETQVFSFGKTNGTNSFPILNPVSLNLNPAYATCIEQGMEVYLLPGEYLYARRVAATAGSTITLTMQFVESDMPLYMYEEPQIVLRQKRAISTIRQRLGGGGVVGGGGPGSSPGRPGGGGGGPAMP